jgi:hypothetical protein
MTTKHWQITLRKGNVSVTLYATTTDEMAEADLRAAEADSLILIARQYHRHPQNQEQNHRDLAIGAFMAYASKPHYDCDFAHIEISSKAPSSLPTGYAGGRDSRLVPIWEEPINDQLL